jgi:hypothetical protein
MSKSGITAGTMVQAIKVDTLYIFTRPFKDEPAAEEKVT